jgi:ABC-2 type transport system ATP-binding protein
MAAIETDGLTKVFPGTRRIPGVRGGSEPVTAVDDLDLVVEEGEVFGFLGPNGAGKSTTINALLDYVEPTAGSATVLGMDPNADTAALHDRLGVLPEEPGFYDRLTARKHLLVAIRTKGAADDPDALLDRVGLSGDAARQVGEFSTGMRQRLGLAMALVGDPDLLILDEPTAGLDPNGVRRLRTIVDEEAARGTPVFFASHVLEQVELVCDRVGILRAGSLVALDTIEGLRSELYAGATVTATLESVPADAAAAVSAVDGVTETTVEGDQVVASCTTGPAKVAVVNALQDAGGTVLDLAIESAELESLFAAYAGTSRDPATDSGSSDGAGSAADEVPAAGEPQEVTES